MSAIDELVRIGKRCQELREELESLQPKLVDLVVRSAREGISPSRIAFLTGRHKDWVRVTLRRSGVEPLPIGRPKKTVN